MRDHILALDEGTTSARAVLFDREGTPCASGSVEFSQSYPRPGWVEQNPEEILSCQRRAVELCLERAALSPDRLLAIGLANQRETVVLWDKATGKSVAPAIGWQCRRTAAACEELAAAGLEPMIHQKTGLRLDPYFSASKLSYLLTTIPNAKEKAARGEWLFGTVDSFLLWHLTQGRVHKTDPTNASRTMLFNIQTGDWDEELLSLFGVPRACLPEVASSAEIYGETEIGGVAVPIAGIAGDQQAALFGQGCTRAGEMKATYGTGLFLLSHTGQSPVFSSSGLLTTLAATPQGAPLQYALEGSVFTGGDVVRWLRDELGFFERAADIEALARQAKTEGVFLVPAFTGLGAPYWDPQARASLLGLTRACGRAEIARAALEAIAFSCADVLTLLRRESGHPIPSMRVDGGATANNLLLQIQADLANVTVLRPPVREATARGAALLAGCTLGLWSPDRLPEPPQQPDSFSPSLPDDRRRTLQGGWQRAVAATRSFTGGPLS